MILNLLCHKKKRNEIKLNPKNLSNVDKFCNLRVLGVSCHPAIIPLEGNHSIGRKLPQVLINVLFGFHLAWWTSTENLTKVRKEVRVPSRGGFGGLNPHQNHLDPHFIWPWVQWTLCIDLSQAGSNFSYGILKSLVCWWPHSSFVLYNVIRKYNICSRIKCQHVTCAQYDPASTPERVNLLLQMKTK